MDIILKFMMTAVGFAFAVLVGAMIEMRREYPVTVGRQLDPGICILSLASLAVIGFLAAV